MGATSWQHIRTFSGDVSHTLEQLRHDVFAARAHYLADECAFPWSKTDSATVACLERPASIGETLRWNGDEGTHSVLDITDGVAVCPTSAAVSPLESEALERCFGIARPTLFEVLMTDFDAGDVCEPGSGRYFLVTEAGEPALVVFVGSTGA